MFDEQDVGQNRKDGKIITVDKVCRIQNPDMHIVLFYLYDISKMAILYKKQTGH